MRTLLTHFIQQHYTGSETRGRFSAVGLFVDLSGFTALTEALMQHGTLGAEALVAVMQSIFGPLVECVYAQGGFVARTAGDAFTAIFPLEEQPAQAVATRALAAAWRMQQHMTANPIYPTPYGDFPVRAKIGLSIGEVGWGIVVSPDGRRAAYYFQGAAVDGCAAAEHDAQPGDIILEAELHAALGDLAPVEPVGNRFRLAGAPLHLPQPQPVTLPPPDPQVMQAFFPAALIHQEHSGEFRHIVSLFVSLPTVRNEAQLSTFMNTVFELQDRYGGLLSSLDFGDKGSNLLLFWGAPLTLENDAERALSFILDLQSLTSIPINAGVTYHLAHAGFIGSRLLDEYNCYGRGINLAARLMIAAPRGEIWVTEQVTRQAQAHFDFEPAGAMSFKGFAEVQPVYILLERKAQQQAIFSGRMLGREAELAELTRWLAPLWQDKSPGVLVVWGEAGIGKSRLLHEFLASPVFEEHPALWAVCQTSEILREPFNPFRYWLRGYLEQSEGQAERLNKRSFNRKLDELIEFVNRLDPTLGDELDRTRSFLGALVDLHWPDSLYEQMDPQGRYQNTLLALIFLLQAESLRQPVVLLLEDAHWLDDDTRQFLPRLQRALTCDDCQVYPLGLVATARHEETGPLLGEGLKYQELLLGGVPQGSLAGLAEGVLDAPAGPGLLDLLAQRAEGNPLFAEQILRYLQEQGLLARENGQWELSAGLDEMPLPTDIGAVLVARLDRLALEVRQVVQTAAVLGREFELLLLRRMLAGDEWVARKVADAGQAAIWSALDEWRYLFRHALMREAAYRMQVTAQRRGLHALAVQAMQSLYAADLSPHYGELAYHSEQAILLELARRYYLLAAETARQQYQNIQSVAYYTRALELTPSDDLEARFSLLVERCKLLRLLGDQVRRLQDLRALDQLAAELGGEAMDAKKALVLEQWALYYGEINDFPASLEYSRRAIIAAHAARALQIEVEALVDQSYALLRLGRHAEAQEQAAQGLQLSRQAGYWQGEITCRNQLGLVHLESGEQSIARDDFQACLEIARQMGDLRGQARALSNLGNTHTNLNLAQEYYLEALRLVRVIGERSKEGMLLGNLGFLAGGLGDFGVARSYAEKSLRIARELGDRFNEVYALINRSAYAGRLGDQPGALDSANQALPLARQIGDPSAEAWALTYLGHACLDGGQMDLAEDSYRQALDIRRRLNQPGLACEPLAGLARWSLQRNNIAGAQERIAEILAFLDGGGTLDGADEPLRVYLSCVQVLQACSDLRAREILETAYAMLQEQAAGIQDLELRTSFLESIPYHREIIRLWGA